MKQPKKNTKSVPEVGIDENKTNQNDSSINQPSADETDEGKKMKDDCFEDATTEEEGCPFMTFIEELIGDMKKILKEKELFRAIEQNSKNEKFTEEIRRMRLKFEACSDDIGPFYLGIPEYIEDSEKVRVDTTASELGIEMGKLFFHTLNLKGRPMFVTTISNAAEMICACYAHLDGTPFNQRTIEDAVAIGKRRGYDKDKYSKN